MEESLYIEVEFRMEESMHIDLLVVALNYQK